MTWKCHLLVLNTRQERMKSYVLYGCDLPHHTVFTNSATVDGESGRETQ